MKRENLWKILLVSMLFWTIIIASWIFISTHLFADIDCTDDNVICVEENISPEEKARDLELYKARGEQYRKDVAGEIERHHELQIETRKIEVLGRLEMLQSSNIVVNNSSYSNTQTIANTGTIKKTGGDL